jgi:hypothetical protein
MIALTGCTRSGETRYVQPFVSFVMFRLLKTLLAFVPPLRIFTSFCGPLGAKKSRIPDVLLGVHAGDDSHVDDKLSGCLQRHALLTAEVKTNISTTSALQSAVSESWRGFAVTVSALSFEAQPVGLALVTDGTRWRLVAHFLAEQPSFYVLAAIDERSELDQLLTVTVDAVRAVYERYRAFLCSHLHVDLKCVSVLV